MKKMPVSLICGVAAMLVTLALYFLILSDVLLEIIHILALIGILLAEGVTTVYAYKSNGEPRKIAAACVAGLMIPYAAFMSIVYVVNFPDGYGAYLGWYFAGVVVTNAIAMILYGFADSKQMENAQLQATKANVLYLRKMVKAIMLEETAKPYADQLRALEEDLHFTNDNVYSAEDEKIREMLQQVQQNIADPQWDVAGQLETIRKLVQLRTVMTSRNA